MSKSPPLKVGISVGDLNGIGVEIILKTFQDTRMMEFCTPVIFANSEAVNTHRKHLSIEVKSENIDTLDSIKPNKINILEVWKQPTPIRFGVSDSSIGQLAFRSLKAAVEALKENKVDVLLTAPINKKNIQSETFNFFGHTEYLESELEGENLMLMLSNNLRIGLLTNHISINEVTATITPELINKKVAILHQSLKQDFRVQKPKIAILGINPHNGDDGLIGNEDQEIITPTIKKIQESGKLVYGPYAADGFFGAGTYRQFDAVLASYHDQGLVPFKALSFGEGVNYTAGLSRVRCSPDHGVAYDIAGKNKASESSFKQAVFTAIEIFKIRSEYQKLSKNPLKTDILRQNHKKNQSDKYHKKQPQNNR